jgi:NADPH-dependent F420 reductase
MQIAILGGTGPEGLGIATRLTAAGESVILGSRSPDRAATAAASLATKVPAERVRGVGNREAAREGEIVFIAVPHGGVDAILAECGQELEGKIVVDVVVPIVLAGGVFLTETVAEGSVAERIQAHLPGARLVSGFKHESAKHLMDLDHEMNGDVLLCGTDAAAKEAVAALIRRIPKLRPIDAGDLRIARLLESMTALLLNLNRRHKTLTSIRIVGL